MRLNFVRLRQLTHALLPGMIERNFGRVVNISGKSEPTGLIAVNPAKAAIHAWRKACRVKSVASRDYSEFDRAGPHNERADPAQVSAEFRAKQSAEEIPMGRYGEPEELAAVAVFLASPVAGKSPER